MVGVAGVGAAGAAAAAGASDATMKRVLVESSKVEVPRPPYDARATSPMVIVAVEGLCNRLRATLSYRQVAHEAGRPLVVVWRKDELCPGYFLDAFLPLAGVRFVKAPPDGRPLGSLHVATDTHPAVKGKPEEAYSYAALQASDAIRTAVAEQVRACGARFAAVHVRRTDLHTWLPVSQHTRDTDFEGFLDDRARTGAQLYLAADNAETQRRFLERYGERMHVHQHIRSSGSLRQTTLRDAVIDMLVCAVATDGFMGSHGSSYSDAIRHLRTMQGRSNDVDLLAVAHSPRGAEHAHATKRSTTRAAAPPTASPLPSLAHTAPPSRAISAEVATVRAETEALAAHVRIAGPATAPGEAAAPGASTYSLSGESVVQEPRAGSVDVLELD